LVFCIFFFSCYGAHRDLHSFPTRRSSDLGPALLMANWEMKPAHLPGMWFDATFDRDPIPIFARVQYRIYRSTTLAPDQGFTAFHPSTLFVGLGFMTKANNTGL